MEAFFYAEYRSLIYVCCLCVHVISDFPIGYGSLLNAIMMMGYELTEAALKVCTKI